VTRTCTEGTSPSGTEGGNEQASACCSSGRRSFERACRRSNVAAGVMRTCVAVDSNGDLGELRI
jgi:hypothetical protein